MSHLLANKKIIYFKEMKIYQ